MVFSISAKALPGSATSRMKTLFCWSSKPGKLVLAVSPGGGTSPIREASGKIASAAAAGSSNAADTTQATSQSQGGPAVHALRYAAPLSETQPCCAMSCDAAPSPEMAPFMPENLLRQPNFAALVALAWLLVALVLLLQYWDADRRDAARHRRRDAARPDARLASAGQGWFDLHQARLQPPLGYDSHWSRLIDAGLAGLFLMFQPVRRSGRRPNG